MADISKCRGTNCPLANTCYRYLAKSDEWQSFMFEVPIKPDYTCEYYWKVESKENLEILDKNNNIF